MKRLFVCTKPYQYLMARLIKHGYGFDDCDLVILNHFTHAEQFAGQVRGMGVWNKVMFIDDGTLDQYKLQLDPIRKFFFYHTWRKKLPEEISDISEYSELYVAHDFIAVEYAIIRKFSNENKRTVLYEEGFGNYINTSTHKTWYMRVLKWLAPHVGLPGSHLGSLKWVDSVCVQRPDLLISDAKNPLRRKAIGLPMKFKMFLQIPRIVEECYQLYPELHDIDERVRGRKVMSVVLTEPFLDDVAEREAFLAEMAAKAGIAAGESGGQIFFKQHPGEHLPIEGSISPRIAVLPQRLPIELLYLVILKNHIRQINLFSFGSTAILNLYELCKADDSLKIFLIDSMRMQDDVKLISSRFTELAAKHQIRFQTM